MIPITLSPPRNKREISLTFLACSSSTISCHLYLFYGHSTGEYSCLTSHFSVRAVYPNWYSDAGSDCLPLRRNWQERLRFMIRIVAVEILQFADHLNTIQIAVSGSVFWPKRLSTFTDNYVIPPVAIILNQTLKLCSSDIVRIASKSIYASSRCQSNLFTTNRVRWDIWVETLCNSILCAYRHSNI